MTITYENLMQAIAEVAAAERITKEKLSLLSRDLLNYVLDNEDIRPINALLGMDGDGRFVLTPINWRIAVQYFHHFIAFTSNFDDVKEFAIKGKGKRTPLVFNKKAKKRWDASVSTIQAWLEDPANDLWVWSNNAEMDAKPVDYAKKVQSAIKSALDEGKGNMSLVDVMSAISELEEVNVYDLMGAMEAMGVSPAHNTEHEEIDRMLENGQITQDEAEQMKAA
tara:strand:- start:42296 stop:42964 length:669 start_codon:yes stop_codon:yes gene_type:complete